MSGNRTIKPLVLDEEEAAIEASLARGEWKTIENLEEEIEKFQMAAANFSRKNKRVNIRISENDLQQIKRRALVEGIPYQTLMSSVLHKYASGTI